MTNPLSELFSADGFMPHGMCYLWRPPILALHIASDLLIALAYFSISLALLHFVRKRRGLQFHWMYICFAAFIVACGTTHLMEIWVIWHPDYWLGGAVKAVTAGASITTAILLLRLVPHALLMANDTLPTELGSGRLAAIVESSHDAIMSETRDGTISSWNHGAEEIFGYSAAEAIGQPSTMLSPLDRADEKTDMWTRIENGEQISSFETVRVNQDGRLIPILDTISPISDASGVIVGASEIARDITDWKQSQETLTEQANILDLAPVIVCDLDGQITRWSVGAERLYGFTRESALGSSSQDLLSTVYYEPLPEIYAKLDSFGVWKGELTRRTREGTQIDVASVRMLHRDSEGKPSRILESNIDLTERKQSEQALAAQVGRLSLLSKITRAIGEREDISSISRHVIQTLEDQLPVDFGCLCLYEDPDSLVVAGIGTKSRDLGRDPMLPEGEYIPVEENGLAPCQQGLLVYEPELSEVHMPLAQRLCVAGFAAMVVVPLLVNKSLFGALLVGRRQPHSFSVDECEFLRQLSAHVAVAAHQADLYKALETAYHDLRKTQKAVLQQEKLRVLGQMASGIAHDINNALAPALLYVESLLEINLGGADSKEYLLIIQRAIEGVAHTVARMKQVYSHEDPLLLRARLNLNRTIEQVIDLTHNRWSTLPEASGRAISLTTDLDADLPELFADESEIRNALTNLILNAVDAMPSGGKLSVRSRALGSDRIQIEVSDTGIGMDEATRNQCLELFFTTKGVLGTGLGLSTVHGAVERHGGEIQIESEVGVGTTMRVILPIAAPAVAPSPSIPEPEARRRLRILVIDDDQVILKSLRLSLQRDGHTVTTAPGGLGGIETFRAASERGQSFEVVITDLGMPHVDGIAVAAAVKSMGPEALVILLTGLGHQLQAADETLSNVDHVLSKPTRLATIRSLLAELTA